MPKPIPTKERAGYIDPEHDMGLLCVMTDSSAYAAYKAAVADREEVRAILLEPIPV
jgi:hypothetical protein